MAGRILGFVTPAAGVLLANGCSSPAQQTTSEPREAKAGFARPAALSSDPLTRAFGNTDALGGWLLGCDNVRVCRAQPRASAGSLMVRRDPGPNGQLIVVLDGEEPGEPLLPDVATIRLAGVAAGAPAPWRFDREADRATLEGEAALAFVRTLPQATSLSYATAEGILEVPLAGLREALAAMDEAQGHAGGEAAFVSIGPRPRAELPPAPAMPVIEVARPAPLPPLPAGFAARVRRSVPHAAECESERQDLDEAHPLNAAEALVILACNHGMRDSYYLLLRAPRERPERAERVILPIIPEADDTYEDGSGTYVNLEWDPESRQLYSMHRSCAGGCGENVTWAFDGERFRLVSYAFYEAGGAESLELYKAEVRPRR